MHTIVLCVFAVTLGGAHGALYQDPLEEPYEFGVLPVESRIINPNLNPINPAPMHNKVFYPTNFTQAEDVRFGVFYFITGFFGATPPALYEDLMGNVAAHGYVSVCTWPASNGQDGVNFTAQAHLENMAWLRENLPRDIRDLPDFDFIGLGCHSAGCAPTLALAELDAKKFMATVNLEPVTVAIRNGAHFEDLPSIHLGAELANGSCSTPNFDYERFYKEFQCPKSLMEASNAGHCDILTDIGRDACVDGGLCATSDETDLPAYRQFVQGLTAAFLNGHVQGNQDMLEYIDDPANIPYPLKQHRQDLC